MQQFKNLMDISSLKCFNQHHNNSALYVSVNIKQNFEERLLCEDCLISQQCTNKMISLTKLIGLILEQKNNQQIQIDFLIQKAIDKISQFCSNINSFKIQLLQLFDKINVNCNQWKEELLTLNQRNQNFDLLFELQQLQQIELIDDNLKTKQFINIKKQLANIHYYHYQNIEYFINELQNNIKDNQIIIKFKNLLKYLQLLNKDNEQKIKQDRQIKLNLIAEKQQENWCGAIAFNKQGSIMVSGYDSNIKVWKLENDLPIETDKILYGHKNQVYCIVFSKQLNQFISGCSGDDKIIFWKQVINSDEWESFSTLETVCTVWCLILSDNEKQLLSSHDDGCIRVWSVKYLENLIIFEYSLQMHNSFVYQISLNESQTQLVSCSEDKQIIIWKLNKNLIWQFGYVVIKDIDDYGQRITFINDDTIIWCQNQGYIHIFQLHDSNFVENVNLQIIPNRIPFSDQFNLFPLIFNQSNEILILKHFQYIYLLQQQVNKQLNIISEPLYFESACMFGNLNDNGSSLVVWNMKTKSFRFYRLDYY